MSLANAFEFDLVKHIFQNAAIALLGDASGVLGSAVAGNVYISLHTADPGEGADQTTNESAYGGYARVAVVRSAVGWTCTLVSSGGSTAVNAAAITFPACISGTSAITHFAVGTSSSGTGKVIISGALTGTLNVSTTTNAIPLFNIGDLTLSFD